MGIEQIQVEMRNELDRAGLLPFLVDGSSQILDLGDEVFAEIVLSDGAKREQARELVSQVLERTAYGRKVSSLVRSKWAISQIGDLTPAYGEDGGLRAAVLIPVVLRSGTESVRVTVAVTKLAEWEFDRILGPPTDLNGRLKQVAELVIEGKLRRGGMSSWDPMAENYLEVTSGSVANISRLLKQPEQRFERDMEKRNGQGKV